MPDDLSGSIASNQRSRLMDDPILDVLSLDDIDPGEYSDGWTELDELSDIEASL